MRTDTEAEAEKAKMFKTWQAIAAMSGFAVEQIVGNDGQASYRVSKWNLSRTCETLGALQTFLVTAGCRL
jgi:hypothetical protein